MLKEILELYESRTIEQTIESRNIENEHLKNKGGGFFKVSVQSNLYIESGK